MLKLKSKMDVIYFTTLYKFISRIKIKVRDEESFLWAQSKVHVIYWRE